MRRIQQVFNDLGKPAELQIIQDLDSGSTQKDSKAVRFIVNPEISPEAIRKIYQ